MQNGKNPGVGGFDIEFYKKFSNQITPILHRMFSHSVESEISLLLKQDRDETEPLSYCPISMLNLDFKIFTKILASHPVSGCGESFRSGGMAVSLDGSGGVWSPSFISWVRMLYAQPTAFLLTNLDRSPAVPLQRWMRKGCPLSPLIFALAI